MGNYHLSVRRNKPWEKKKTLQVLKRQNKEAFGEFGAGWEENGTRKY